jgi:hypothetical protein
MSERFMPVRGTYNQIKKMPIREGWLYFAYDTGNIYIDKNGTRYLMGGSSSGILYAHGSTTDILKEEPDNEHSFRYIIPMSAFDDTLTLPHTDSLVLNSDGRFFRVLSVNETEHTVLAVLLAVSGGGNGSGGGSIITYSDKAKLNKVDPESNYLINGKEASIRIYALSGKDYDGSILDNKLTVYWTLSEKTETGILSQYA